MGYSVGIGLTNDCNLACAHCYRDTGRVDALSLAQVQQICEAIPVDALGMGTGENALHPEFVPIVRYLSGRGVKLSLASNGYSLTTIADDVLLAFHDVEVSIDFATEAEQDTFRGPGNWALVHRAMARCRSLGVEASILATMMRTNYDQMDQLVALARRNGVNLRVNAYQAVKTDAYRLTYAEFWEGYRRLFAEGLVISCSEPVVRAAMGLDGRPLALRPAQPPLQPARPDHPLRLLADGWRVCAEHRGSGPGRRGGAGQPRVPGRPPRPIVLVAAAAPAVARSTATWTRTTTIARGGAGTRSSWRGVRPLRKI